MHIMQNMRYLIAYIYKFFEYELKWNLCQSTCFWDAVSYDIVYQKNTHNHRKTNYLVLKSQ